MDLMEKDLMDDAVHQLGHIGICSIHATCGAVMQAGDGSWTNNVNYWGKTGVRRERPFTTLTLDAAKVTCKKCKTIAAEG